ncbi:11758_t:CDS:2, partial [Scutellospora calospora]
TIRSNPKTQLIPLILLSAKVGEDSSIEGLDKGADDYLTKPFSSRELITRIRTNIELSQLRRKFLFQQCKQEQTKQLLFSISNKILSGFDLKEILSSIIGEIHQILPSERIFIISCELPEFKNRTIIALSEDNKSLINISFMKQTIINSQKILNINSGVEISFDTYCLDTFKKVSMLSVEIKVDNIYKGWIKAHRPPNSTWLDSEIEMLQQISNQINLAIIHANLLKDKLEKEVQIKANEVANIVKSQILANTSHELRTPLGAVVGILSSFDRTNLTDDQKDMINIMTRASDAVLYTVNNILDAAKLKAQKIILINDKFDLLNLFEEIIESFSERAGAKQVELILNCEVDKLPKYVKKGEIVLKISLQPLQSQKVIDGKPIKKANLLIEVFDTGIGVEPEFIRQDWESFSQGDISINRRQHGTGLGLSICKKLVTINGGEINVESQLGKGSKFWFTWNVELLTKTSELQINSPKLQFDEKVNYCSSYIMKLNRILIIHPVKSVRDAMIKYFKKAEKVDTFDKFDKGIIQEVKNYKQLYNQSAYDIIFIRIYEKNEKEVIKLILELREIGINMDKLLIVFITFPNNTGKALAEKLVKKIGGQIAIIYTPITWSKLINLLSHIKDNKVINRKCNIESISTNTNILKEITNNNNSERIASKNGLNSACK